MTAKPLVYVKGDPEHHKLLDCPFSHRVLLAMEEKHMDRDLFFVDEYNKQPEFLEVYPEGKIPVLKLNDRVIPDSDKILPLLEEMKPEPSLKNPGDLESLMQNNTVFPAFVEFLMEEDCRSQTARTKEENLLLQLDQLEEALGRYEGPFFGGDHPVQADVTFAPRLYHVTTALGAIRNWELPAKYSKLREFLSAWKQRESWRNLDYGTDVMVDGWKRKISMLKGQQK